MNAKLIDWPTFIGALVVLLAVTLPLIFFPEAGEAAINMANNFLTGKFGVLYLALGLFSLVFLLYVAFSKYGKIKLGKRGTEKEFGSFSWAAMLFSAGIGASILYWGMIEWAYYYQGPPFGVTPETKEAIELAATYGIFHWGPIAWAIYTIPALPIAYFYFVRKKPVLKISAATRPVIGRLADGPIGTIIDVLFIFGLLGGAGTTLALGTPMIAEGVHDITGIPVSLGLKTGIMVLCTCIFAASAYSGLNKGIKVLSDVNIWLAIFILIFIFVFGPTVFISESTFTSLGVLLDNFFHMATWLEPLAQIKGYPATHFPESWTIFYWAWWTVYAPFVGLFVARISYGRTIREMIFGTLIYGTLGCILFFGILGNFGLYLQLSESFDVINFMNENGASATIIAILHQLPISSFIVIVFTILAIIFLSTTFDSASYILAAVVQKHVPGGEAMRWNRLFWAFALLLLPLVLMFYGDLEALQTASIVAGFPVMFIMILLGISFIKAAGEDIRAQKEYRSPTIYIDRRNIEKKTNTQDKAD
ncbi:BCCT family transporter [Ornithinibacillus bavariensis]|uniref:Transporter n=1 Tax=Ornithinibacillus bavariensis TaxID=545502 RepID=A0A920C4S6_9BACI|nr:BCCT family transporter [Ornithinibacillus bavariensis]GIO25945.1 transporter [Ornithinibacillus bavariensis]HAM79655.1 choline transporter [Ornithinibacillus sp.]